MLSIRWITRIAIAFCCALAFAAPLPAQTILRVDGDQGSATGDGSDWGPLAFKFLQDALDEAAISEPPVQLWVAATDPSNPYLPDRDAANPDGSCDPDPCDRNATFNLINNVELYGGFFGDETVLSQRNPEANETVLSGAITDLVPGCGPGAGRHNLPILAIFPLRFRVVDVGSKCRRGSYRIAAASA